MLKGQSILITGGIGSLDTIFARYVLENYILKRVIVYFCDMFKQYIIQNKFTKLKDRLRFYIRDACDYVWWIRVYENVNHTGL